MAANYGEVLAQLQAFGLLVDSVETGRMRRCLVQDGGREKRGWYVLHEIRLDSGLDVIVGGYGMWQGNESHSQKIVLGKDYTISVAQKEAVRQRMAEDKKRAERERQREAERAAEAATKVWRAAATQGDCDYLQKKGVGAHGVRFTAKGAMLVPMLDATGKVHGLQVIRSSTQEGRAKEFWPAGLAKKGHFYLLGMPAPGAIVLLAEGYATGASLHEATGLPVAVAFDAGNLVPVAQALHKRYKLARLLVCADDDATQKCRACKSRVWLADGAQCPACGQEHGAANAGVAAASAAALAVGGAWLAPSFADLGELRASWLEQGRKANDFNDLAGAEGLQAVRVQVEARLLALGWRVRGAAPAGATQGGGVPARLAPLRPIDSLDELLERFALVYGQGGTAFDGQEHMLVPVSDMRDACLTRDVHKAWAEHPDKRLVRVTEVGFDPTGRDKNIQCNLWAGWPTQPQAGKCQALLDLLRHMCSADQNGEQLYQWVLRWVAYPIQHPGAKMKTTLVVHGPQGTGKNMFFEAVMDIYGRYGRVIDQSAIEDKFNDWASRKLFLIADEVVARSDLYHVKNKLKAFITGEWIRINPKNMGAYDERNHVNMVFLSNEAMPVVLEADDRRHTVIWTPDKLDASFYAAVKAEIESGGVAALHDYLLHLDLGAFSEATMPLSTDAKRELIDLGLDSPCRFVKAFKDGDIDGFPGEHTPALLLPALSTDLFELYTLWCRSVNLKALSQPRFANALARKHRARIERKRYHNGLSNQGPAATTWLGHCHELPPGRSEGEWLGERIDIFRTTLRDYKNRGLA